MKPNDKALDEALSVTQIPEESMRKYMQRVLIAAYAAQFQSDDYAGLVERLRLRAGIHKDTTDDKAAADAIEALLAERDEWKNSAQAHVKGWMRQCDKATSAIKECDELAKERDALKADLASARDMTWFWEIVDAAGLNNVASCEKDALRELVRDSAILDGLKARFGDIGKGDGQFTVESTFQSLLNVIDFNVELADKLTAAEKERDDLFAEIDAISSAIQSPRYMDPPDGGSVTIAEQVSRMWEDNEVIRTERDALLARLAPVDDDKLREIAAKHVAGIDGHSDDWDRYVDEAKDYIDAVRPHIEAAERERCAKIADDCDKSTHPADVAAAIRSGK